MSGSVSKRSAEIPSLSGRRATSVSPARRHMTTVASKSNVLRSEGGGEGDRGAEGRRFDPNLDSADSDTSDSDSVSGDEGDIVSPRKATRKRKQVQRSSSSSDQNPFAALRLLEDSTAAKPKQGSPKVHRDKKSPLLNVILNHVFWNVSRRPSLVQLKRFQEILEIGRDEDMIWDDVELHTLQTWFRSKRFNVRRTLMKFLHDHPNGTDLFETLSNHLKMANLAILHEVQAERNELLSLDSSEQHRRQRRKYEDMD